MFFDKALAVFKQVLSSAGFFYIVILVLALLVVDFKALDMRIKMRRLNDARPEMGMLVAFGKGDLAAEKVDWTPYLKYFSMVVKYMPDEKVSRMFLGVCEYHAGDAHKSAWPNILRAAEEPPFVFWGMYNAGVLAFERGDLAAAVRYLERSLIVPADKLEAAIRGSVVYRQVMAASNFDVDVMRRISAAKEDVYLLLAAANFYAKDYGKALAISLYALEKMAVKDKEPFYFYAGAASLSSGRLQEALVFFSRCVELRSRNPYVYRYVADILTVSGKNDEAQDVMKMSQALDGKQAAAFPYSQRLQLRFF